MSDDIDFELICDYYSRLERQGPGSPEITQKALGYIKGLTSKSRIADIGCGTGGQTLVIAQHAPGTVAGVDMLDPFIDQLNLNAAQLGLQGRVTGVTASMDKLPFQDEELDLIWSEGAIYNIGFEKGLNEWKRFLKPGGYMAVSELSWFTEERPAAINDFWSAAYPEIDTLSNKVKKMKGVGYELVATFKLPESCWIDHYYAPQEKFMDYFLKAHPGSEAAAAIVAEQREEAELYHRFKEHYGYAFYIGKKSA